MISNPIKNHRPLYLLICLSLLIFAWMPVQAKPARPIDRIAAIVNDGVILQSELNRRLVVAVRELKARGLPVPARSKLKKQALDRLIVERLQLQLAARSGVTASKGEVNQAIADMAKKNHMPLSQFKQSVRQLGISYAEYHQHIHDQMIMGRLQSQAIRAQMQLSEQEVSALIDTYQRQRPRVIKYHLWDVMVPLSNQHDKNLINLAREQARLIASRLRLGADVKHIVETLPKSQNPAPVSNDLGWRNIADLPQLFVKPARHLQHKQVSRPIQAPNGFHVLQLLGKKDITPRLTPKQARMHAYEMRFNEKLAAWLKKMRASAYVKIIAR